MIAPQSPPASPPSPQPVSASQGQGQLAFEAVAAPAPVPAPAPTQPLQDVPLDAAELRVQNSLLLQRLLHLHAENDALKAELHSRDGVQSRLQSSLDSALEQLGEMAAAALAGHGAALQQQQQAGTGAPATMRALAPVHVPTASTQVQHGLQHASLTEDLAAAGSAGFSAQHANTLPQTADGGTAAAAAAAGTGNQALNPGVAALVRAVVQKHQASWRARKEALKAEVTQWQHTAWRYATAWKKAKAELAVGRHARM